MIEEKTFYELLNDTLRYYYREILKNRHKNKCHKKSRYNHKKAH